MKALKADADRGIIMRLAIPAVLQNIAETLVSLIDTAMVGSLGAVASAAVGVCASPTWLINGLVQSIAVGGTALVAREIGAKNAKEAEHIAHQTFRLSIYVALFLSILMFLISPLIPVLMQAKEEVLGDATAYMRIVSCSYLMHYVGIVLTSLLHGAGDTKTSMIAGFLANIVNVVGNFLLIYETRSAELLGHEFTIWGAGLGVRGAAIATAFSFVVSFIYTFIHMTGVHSALRLKPFPFEKFDTPLLKRIFRIALPHGLERVAVNMGQIVFAAMFSSFGTVEIAAYQISIQIEGLGYMPAYGFANAATALIGQKLGAKEPDQAEKYGKKCTLYSLISLSVIAVFMYLLSPVLAQFFSSDASVVSTVAAFVAIVAFEQPFNAISIVISGGLRGAGDTTWPFLCGLISMWLVRVLGAWLVGFKLGLGVYAMYWAMVADLAVRSLLLWLRFRNGKWKLKRV